VGEKLTGAVESALLSTNPSVLVASKQ